mgnify:FL=1
MFTALQKYAVFSGRAQRKEFWLFNLLYLIAYIIAFAIDMGTGTYVPTLGMGTATLILTLAFVIPALAVSFRRLHDTDRSAWWLLIALVPLVGSIVLLVFFCLDGSAGENRFGHNPKELVTAAPA